MCHFRACQKGKNVVLLPLPVRHTFYPRDSPGITADTDILSTPLEPFQPKMCLLGLLLILHPFRESYPPKKKLCGVNRRFQTKRAKY